MTIVFLLVKIKLKWIILTKTEIKLNEALIKQRLITIVFVTQNKAAIKGNQNKKLA